MNDYFCVFKRSGAEEAERRVVIQSHGQVFSGLVKFAKEEIGVGDVQNTLSRLSKKKKSMALWCSREDLPKDSPFHNVADTLDDTSTFVRDEIFEAQEILDDMAQYGMTAWIDEGDNKSYFELRTRKEHLPEVELACAKLYIGTIKLHVIYVGSSYYVTLSDVASSEQSLEDDEFPDISSRGAGFQIKLYDGLEFQHLALWQLLDAHALNMRQILREMASGAEGKEEKVSSVSSCSDDEEEGARDTGYRDITYVDESYLWGRSKEAFGGSYTQTYLMLRPQDSSEARRALFRYGNWCYGGYVNMDQEVNLHDVPLVLRKFQRQQGKLAYWFEVQNLPDGLPFSAPMKHFAMTSAFLEEEITRSEDTLVEITEYHKAQGIRPWVDEENGCQFFELETAGDQEHFREVELMASKTYLNGVVVITLYFQGSFYVTLSPCIDDQPLLDMSFPDVESKGRALQLATYQHAEYKKLVLWQSNRSVWETANRAVLEQRRQAALKREREAQMAQRSEQQERVASESKTAPESKITDDAGSDPSSELADGDSVRADEGDKASSKAKAAGVARIEPGSPTGKSSLERQASALSRGTLEQKMQTPGARAPHHLKPMGSVGASNKLPALDKGLVAGDAPWDEMGRPKSLFGASPIGAAGSNKK